MVNSSHSSPSDPYGAYTPSFEPYRSSLQAPHSDQPHPGALVLLILSGMSLIMVALMQYPFAAFGAFAGTAFAKWQVGKGKYQSCGQLDIAWVMSVIGFIGAAYELFISISLALLSGQ